MSRNEISTFTLSEKANRGFEFGIRDLTRFKDLINLRYFDGRLVMGEDERTLSEPFLRDNANGTYTAGISVSVPSEPLDFAGKPNRSDIILGSIDTDELVDLVDDGFVHDIEQVLSRDERDPKRRREMALFQAHVLMQRWQRAWHAANIIERSVDDFQADQPVQFPQPGVALAGFEGYTPYTSPPQRELYYLN